MVAVDVSDTSLITIKAPAPPPPPPPTLASPPPPPPPPPIITISIVALSLTDEIDKTPEPVVVKA
jgi:hypothetical protein